VPGIELDNRLKDLRARHNLTQGELAERVGVSRKTVKTVKKGVFTPSATLALRLTLGVKVEQLFSLRD